VTRPQLVARRRGRLVATAVEVPLGPAVHRCVDDRALDVDLAVGQRAESLSHHQVQRGVVGGWKGRLGETGTVAGQHTQVRPLGHCDHRVTTGASWWCRGAYRSALTCGFSARSACPRGDLNPQALSGTSTSS